MGGKIIYLRKHFRAVTSMIATVLCCAVCTGHLASLALAQRRLPDVGSAPVLPEPIYWKQHLFLVPYQWTSPTEAGAAQAVWLYVSKDRGASWHKISEAKPQVTAFNYRAEGDGEYWFAVRTIDHQGRAWPLGDYQPELRVIVDTMMPQFNGLTARRLDDGRIEIEWRAADPNLDPTSIQLEVQTDAGAWQTVPPESLAPPPNVHLSVAANPGHAGRFTWQPAINNMIMAVRATVRDLAGNRATYQAPLSAAPAGSVSPVQSPPPAPDASNQSMAPAPRAGWTSATAMLPSLPSAPASQPWAPTTTGAPFRLFHGEAHVADDGVTAYGSVPAFGSPQLTNQNERPVPEQRAESRFPGPVANAPARSPDLVPLEPFRQASLGRSSASADGMLAAPPARPSTNTVTPSVPPKQVGSRTFALQYDVDDTTRGLTNVELWGTRDGGQTWRSYARDDDLRSPIVVTVDAEGLYGFRIVVQSAGLVASPPPASGDEPELWVAVDLQRPVIELTGTGRGEGNLLDHLFLRWRAVDDNLDARPIALFYSSRPGGPWSAIATHLENTGEYAWRVERHVPGRFYLRVEARDAAGNLAAFQTREPIEFSPFDASGSLRESESWGPTAVGADAAYR
jgi:hypothetical protein